MLKDIHSIATNHIFTQSMESYHNKSLRRFFNENKNIEEEYIKFIEKELLKFQPEIDSYNIFVNEINSINNIKIEKFIINDIIEDNDSNIFINVSISDDNSFSFNIFRKNSKDPNKAFFGERAKISLNNSEISLKASYGSSINEIEFFLNNSNQEDDISRNMLKLFASPLRYDHKYEKILIIKDIGRKIEEKISKLFSDLNILKSIKGEDLLNISKEKIEIISLKDDLNLNDSISKLKLDLLDYNSKIKPLKIKK